MCVFGWCWDSPPCPPLLVRRPLKGVNWRRIEGEIGCSSAFSYNIWQAKPFTLKPHLQTELQRTSEWDPWKKKTSVPTIGFCTQRNPPSKHSLQIPKAKYGSWGQKHEILCQYFHQSKVTVTIHWLFQLFGGQESPTKTCLSSHLQQTFAVSAEAEANWPTSDASSCNKTRTKATKLSPVSFLKQSPPWSIDQRCGFRQQIFLLQPHQPVFPYHRPRYTNELHGHHRSSQYLRIQYSEYVSNHLGRHFKPSIVGLGFENNSALIYRWQGFPVVKLLMLALHMRHWSPEMMNSAVIHSAKLFFFVDPIQTYQYIISLIVIYIVYQHLYI